MKLIDCHNHIGVEPVLYFQGFFPYAQHLQDLVSKQQYGISRWIVFPFCSNIAMDFGALRKGEITYQNGMESTPFAWENRRLMQEVYDLFPEEGRAVLPFVIVDPLHETEQQAAELRKLRQEYSFHGIKLQTTILRTPIKSLFNEGRVFLELAQEWDIPLLIHSSVLVTDTWAQASDILDIAEATPQVRFCLAHSLRFDKPQLDRLAGLPNTWFDCSAHRIHCQLAVENSPSVAALERRFDSDYTRPARVLLDLAEAYPKKLMWGSDSPAYSFVAEFDNIRYELLSSYKEEVDCLMALPENLRQQVAESNTLEFLQLSQGSLDEPA